MRTAAAGYPLRLSSGGQLPVPSALYARILTLQICTVIILHMLCFVKRKLGRGRRFPVLYKVPALFFSKIGQLSRARHAPASVGAVVPFPRPCHRGKQNAGRTGRTGKRGEAEQRRTRGEQVIRQHGNTSGQARGKPLLQHICGRGTRTASGGVQGLLRPRAIRYTPHGGQARGAQTVRQPASQPLCLVKSVLPDSCAAPGRVQAYRSPHIRACRLQCPANRLRQRRRQPLRQPSVIPVLEPENHLLRDTFRLLRAVRDKPDRPRLPPVRYLRPRLLPLREAIRAKCRDDSAVQATEGRQERAASRTARREEQVGQHTADRRYRAPHITPPRPPPAGGGSAPYNAWTGGYSPPSSGSQTRARPESPCAGHVSLPYTAGSASEARSKRCTSA